MFPHIMAMYMVEKPIAKFNTILVGTCILFFNTIWLNDSHNKVGSYDIGCFFKVCGELHKYMGAAK